jgi:hypothetical protein
MTKPPSTYGGMHFPQSAPQCMAGRAQRAAPCTCPRVHDTTQHVCAVRFSQGAQQTTMTSTPQCTSHRVHPRCISHRMHLEAMTPAFLCTSHRAHPETTTPALRCTLRRIHPETMTPTPRCTSHRVHPVQQQTRPELQGSAPPAECTTAATNDRPTVPVRNEQLNMGSSYARNEVGSSSLPAQHSTALLAVFCWSHADRPRAATHQLVQTGPQATPSVGPHARRNSPKDTHICNKQNQCQQSTT